MCYRNVTPPKRYDIFQIKCLREKETDGTIVTDVLRKIKERNGANEEVNYQSIICLPSIYVGAVSSTYAGTGKNQSKDK